MNVISSLKEKKVSLIIKTWIRQNSEAILCQRSLINRISFIPIKLKEINSNRLTFFIKMNSKTIKSLERSKFIYKTASILTHKSSRSNPRKNRGILFIGSILDWHIANSEVYPQMTNHSIWKNGDKLLLVRLELFKASYWSGVSFGSYQWEKIPKNLFKGFMNKSLFPQWRNGKKVSMDDRNIYNSSQFLIVAVITKHGTIHVTPVDFTAINNRIIFATSFSSAKFKAYVTSNIMVGYAYETVKGFANHSKSLTFHGSTFVYGWNIATSFFYLFIFVPYLLFVIFWFLRKYPRTMRRFPFRSTNYRWQFMPIIGRTFFEIFWQD